MGSHPVSFTVKGDEAKVRTAFKQKWNDDRSMYGSDSYNGSFSTLNGITFVTQIFDNIEAAQNHIDEYQEKWGPAFAVRFKVYKSNKTMERLAGEILEIGYQLFNCHRDKLTNRKIASLEKKEAREREKLEAWRAKKAATAKRTEWLVGGWAAS